MVSYDRQRLIIEEMRYISRLKYVWNVITNSTASL
jgi:hypothetical protein